MVEKGFGSVYKGIKYGLIRISDDLILLDFNSAASAIVPLPRRGSCIASLLGDKGKTLGALDKKPGSVQALDLIADGRYLRAIAFRETCGDILCFLHPLFAALGIGKAQRGFSKALSFYAQNILWILEEAASEEHMGFRMASFSDKTYFSALSSNKSDTVSSAVRALVEKLGNTELNKQLTVVVDKLTNGWAAMVSLSVVQTVTAELLSVFELYGSGEGSVMHIGCSEHHLRIFLRDKLKSKTEKSDIYFIRIFAELMRLIDVGCDVNVAPDGSFFVKCYIPTSCERRMLRVEQARVEGEEWAYFDYYMNYFSLAK